MPIRRFNEWDSTLSNRNFEELTALDRANREVAGRTLATFTVTDPRYQRSEKYLPDKINDWVEVSAIKLSRFSVPKCLHTSLSTSRGIPTKIISRKKY